MDLSRAPLHARHRCMSIASIGDEPATPESVQEARKEVLRVIQQRKDLAEWILENLLTMKGCTSDTTKVKLRRQNSTFSETYDQTADKLVTSIENYANSCGRLLSSDIAFSIPVELRMIVFSYLTAEPDEMALGYRSFYLPNRESRDSDNLASEFETLMLSKFYFERNFMEGLEMEVIEAFFSCNTFHLFDSFELKDQVKLSDFHWLDNHTVAPMDLIGRLVIELRGDAEQLLSLMQNWEAIGEKLISLQELCQTLEHVLTFKQPSKLQIEVMISAESAKRLDDILYALQEVRTRLIVAGVKVHVTSREYTTLKYPRSLDAFFDSNTDWKAHLEQHRKGLISKL